LSAGEERQNDSCHRCVIFRLHDNRKIMLAEGVSASKKRNA
jgi:hypothetical protein